MNNAQVIATFQNNPKQTNKPKRTRFCNSNNFKSWSMTPESQQTYKSINSIVIKTLSTCDHTTPPPHTHVTKLLRTSNQETWRSHRKTCPEDKQKALEKRCTQWAPSEQPMRWQLQGLKGESMRPRDRNNSQKLACYLLCEGQTRFWHPPSIAKYQCCTGTSGPHNFLGGSEPKKQTEFQSPPPNIL